MNIGQDLTGDNEVIRKVLSGEREDFACLVRSYQAKVIGLCIGLLKNRAAAEDAAQEVFLKAYRSLESFRHESMFSTWLYRITYHHCQDITRKSVRLREESWEALMDHDGEKLEKLLLDRSQPSSASPEAGDLISRVLSILPPDYRTILILREMQGLSYDEISQVMDCSLDSVKARLRRAREDLAKRLRHLLKAENV